MLVPVLRSTFLVNSHTPVIRHDIPADSQQIIPLIGGLSLVFDRMGQTIFHRAVGITLVLSPVPEGGPEPMRDRI